MYSKNNRNSMNKMANLLLLCMLGLILGAIAEHFEPAQESNSIFMKFKEDFPDVEVKEEEEETVMKMQHQPSSSFNNGYSDPMHVNGIFPNLAATADSGPIRSECGIGALMPWANNLYMVTYLSVPNAGSGTGLYQINPDFSMIKLRDHNSTYANRIIHKQTSQVIIGAWIIDMYGVVRTFDALTKVRVGATAEHLTHPQSMVYMLSMDGPLWECNVTSLECTELYNLVSSLEIPSNQQPHFKAAHTMNGRLVVASNTFDERDFARLSHGGRLAEWRGPGTNWTILEQTAFVEVTGRANFGRVMYALGWDERSVILKVLVGEAVEKKEEGVWKTYRLPKASHAYDHLWQTEWPRIREVETERYLMDMHGLFYELSPLGWSGTTFGIRPVSQHLRMVPDFTSYRGFLVLAGNQVSSILDNNVVTGQAQSGLWFGKTDDLWSFGKPQGWGAVFRRDKVVDGQVSDPFLMTGFDKKMVHMYHVNSTATDKPVTFSIEIDFTGGADHFDGENWVAVADYQLDESNRYAFHVFPDGFSAHWVRIKIAIWPIREEPPYAYVTAQFTYT